MCRKVRRALWQSARAGPLATLHAFGERATQKVHAWQGWAAESRRRAAAAQDLSAQLAEITGFDAVSLQPNSGASGEYAGLMTIRQYHKSRGDEHRNVCIIPVSAHGTNPASAVMVGMTIVPIGVDAKGNVDIGELREKAAHHKDKCARARPWPATGSGASLNGGASRHVAMRERPGLLRMLGRQRAGGCETACGWSDERCAGLSWAASAPGPLPARALCA